MTTQAIPPITSTEDETGRSYRIAALYRFFDLQDPAALKTALLEIGIEKGITGTMILATEGMNGTIAAEAGALQVFLMELRRLSNCPDLEIKFSEAIEPPFQRFKIKIKPEIVTMRAGALDPLRRTGIYVAPEDWNQLIRDPEVLLLDTRNDFEVRMGTFQGADNPEIAYFRHFPEYVQQHLDPQKHRKVAMFCTGGIRCEKASAYMLEQGFEEVYQLEGGILKYLETVEESDQLWEGECFVFDDRIAVDRHLQPTRQTYPPRPGRE